MVRPHAMLSYCRCTLTNLPSPTPNPTPTLNTPRNTRPKKRAREADSSAGGSPITGRHHHLLSAVGAHSIVGSHSPTGTTSAGSETASAQQQQLQNQPPPPPPPPSVTAVSVLSPTAGGEASRDPGVEVRGWSVVMVVVVVSGVQ